MSKIFIVDDQAATRESLLLAVAGLGHEGHAFPSGQPALEMYRTVRADLVISDVRMPGLDGFGLLRAVKNLDPSAAFIMMTAYSSIEDAVSAMKLGATDYIAKPFDLREIEAKIRKILESSEKSSSPADPVDGFRFDGFLSRNKAMQQVYDMVRKAAQNRSSVFIRGESGTGKELIARAIHMNGPEPGRKPFIKVNCAALAEGVLESELFGHEQGSFTGALALRQGKFESANNGTRFLDEIGDIPLSTQVKLLRVLQEKEFERVGGNEPIKVDVRIITATNKDLESLVQTGAFREDLFYRLNVIPMTLPPLRERPEDVPDLAHYFAEKNKDGSPVGPVTCSPELLETLQAYAWPGNVRELENLVERMTVLASEPLLTPESLPPEVRSKMASRPTREKDSFTERATNYEKQLIEEALQKTGRCQVEAARQLNMDRSTLRYKMKKYGLLP
ncbi:MAG: sigma-54 dependent transcriptional regulator [Fibrobacterota bacterium]